jgi:thiamine monophosphate synthase
VKEDGDGEAAAREAQLALREPRAVRGGDGRVGGARARLGLLARKERVRHGPLQLAARQAVVHLEALVGGDVACLQIRLKDADDAHITEVVRVLAPLAQARDVAVILNDRPDLAARLGCDGVHVGQGDMGCAEARRIMGKDRIVGVTCHDSESPIETFSIRSSGSNSMVIS